MSSNEENREGNNNNNSPDYGSNYVPNAGPAHLAPKSLDHFKRGYQERAAQREKEYYSRRHGPTGRERNFDFRQDRPTVVNGLDVNQLATRMSGKLSDKAALFMELDRAREAHPEAFETGRAMTALISVAARRRNIGLGWASWDYMDHANLRKNTFHYNSMISITEKAQNYHQALDLMKEMSAKQVPKNEVTFSSAISACEKCGEWKTAIQILDSMDEERVKRTAIAYNATISACEKGMVPQKACEVFQRMKGEGVRPSVVSYSALISAAEKGGQWKLALDILEEMKREGFTGNVVAYSAAISALAKGQQWRRALQLFREIQSHGGSPSIVTYNATMTALEKGMQWERAMDLFEEMKMRNLSITVVSYGSAISACDKGFQFRQCLEFLDEMTDMGIPKNVIIFGAAMSCMEKCSRADIGFELLKRMREEGIHPNVHIFNSLISACARSNLWEKGYALYEEMEKCGVKRDVVTYNAVLDAVSSQISVGRMLFKVGVEKGFYAKVSRLGEHWFELDLHFLSLGGGEIALGWWFEDCLVPYLQDTSKLATVKSISIVTGYGKTRTRGRRHGDDGMRKRCKAMLRFMNIGENEQTNAGRIHVDKQSLIEEVNRNGGRVKFDIDAYTAWKEVETTANVIPDVEQKIRARFKPKVPGSGRPPFMRVESESTSAEYMMRNMNNRHRREDESLGNEYHHNIDYAVRDGIRFKLGAQNGPEELHADPRGANSKDDHYGRGNHRGHDCHGEYGDTPQRSGEHYMREMGQGREETGRGSYQKSGANHQDSRNGSRQRDSLSQYDRPDQDQAGVFRSDRGQVERHDSRDRVRGRDSLRKMDEYGSHFPRSDKFDQRGRDEGYRSSATKSTGDNNPGERSTYGRNGHHHRESGDHNVLSAGGERRKQNQGYDRDSKSGGYPDRSDFKTRDSNDHRNRSDEGSYHHGEPGGPKHREGYSKREHQNGYDKRGTDPDYNQKRGNGYNNKDNQNRSRDYGRSRPKDDNFRRDQSGYRDRSEHSSRAHTQSHRDEHPKSSGRFEEPRSLTSRVVSEASTGSCERRPSARGYALEPPGKRTRLSY